MFKQMDQSWKEWIQLNISRGCDKEGMTKILFENGFDPVVIASELRYFPRSPGLIVAINNSLHQHISVETNPNKELAAYRDIDAINPPFSVRFDTDKAHIHQIESFLSESECAALIHYIREQNRPSTLTLPDKVDKYFRTSKTCDLSSEMDGIVREIGQRIAEYMGFEPERAEIMQGQYYQVGNQFKSHTDYFEPNTQEYEQFASQQGQRTWTFMIYLNDVKKGGETQFPELGLEIKPKAGMAITWNNALADGRVNPQTLHWGKPVLHGEKYIITQWFRTQGSLSKPFETFPYKKLPIFTDEGFKKTTLPLALQEKINRFYVEKKDLKEKESSDAIGTFIKSEVNKNPACMIELDDETRAAVFEVIYPMLEAWVNKKLKPSAIYGIREYQHGATLAMHVDRIDTHQISAIINVAQAVNTDWPLHICDHKGRVHKVMMQPGDILFYESARLKHGRPEPLDGAYFANIFTHSVPA